MTRRNWRTAAAESSLEFLSKEYDDFGEFRRHAQQEIQRLHNRLLEIRSKVETVGKAIEELEDYSYQFNIKIIEHIAAPESAKDTSTPPIADRNPTENWDLLFETVRRSFNSYIQFRARLTPGRALSYKNDGYARFGKVELDS